MLFRLGVMLMSWKNDKLLSGISFDEALNLSNRMIDAVRKRSREFERKVSAKEAN